MGESSRDAMARRPASTGTPASEMPFESMVREQPFARAIEIIEARAGRRA